MLRHKEVSAWAGLAALVVSVGFGEVEEELAVVLVGDVADGEVLGAGVGVVHAHLQAVFDVEGSTALSDNQKRRVVSKAGPTLRAVAQDERSQLRNRELAVERLVEKLRQALHVDRKRVPTKPSKAAKERRLEAKRRRSDVKRLRRAP